MTEKLGGETIKKVTIISNFPNEVEFNQFKADLDRIEKDPMQVDLYLKAHGLEQVEGLKDYILNNDVQQGSVNELITQQNYKNISDQAHGFKGVSAAIKAYNDSLQKNSDNTTTATAKTQKLIEALSGSNSKLSDCMKKADGSSINMGNYAGSLVTATAKTLALEAATMAMNAAVSYGISVVISAIVAGVDNLINYAKYAKEESQEAKQAMDEINSSVKSQQDLISESGDRYAELAQHVNQLNNTNLDLKEDEYKEFLDISNQIAEQFPSLIKGYDDNGNAILNLNGNVATINSTLDDYVEKAKEASDIELAQIFTGEKKNEEGDEEEYFEGAKIEAEELSSDYDTKRKKNSAMKTLHDMLNGELKGQISDEDNAYIPQVLDELLESKAITEKQSTVLRNQFERAHKESDYYKKFNSDIKQVINGREPENEYQTESFELFLKSRDTISENLLSYQDSEEQALTDLQNKNAEISKNAQSILKRSKLYLNENTTDEMRAAMSNALNTIDWSQLPDVNTGQEAAEYIRKQFSQGLSKLEEDDKTIVESFFNANPEEMDLSGYIDLYEKVKEIFEKQGINIPINIKDVQDGKNIKDTFNKSLEKMSAEDQETVKKYLIDHGLNTAPDIDVWNKRTEGIYNATEAIEAFEKKAKEVSKQSDPSPISFESAWDSLGTEGTDEQKKAAQEAKEKLEELAKAGKLTTKAFENSSIAEGFLKQTGLSAEEATEKINKLKSSADQLSSMKTGISSISSILGGKKENLSDKKTKTVGIGADTLAGMPEDIKAQTDEYEHFVEVLGAGTSTMDECRDAANKLATAYVNSNNFLSNLTKENEDYYISVLDEMGVENASAVVKQQLAVNEQKLALEKKYANEVTLAEIEEAYNAKDATDTYRLALIELALEKQGVNQLSINTADDVDALYNLGLQAGYTAQQLATLSMYQDALSKGYMPSADLKKLGNEADKLGKKILKKFKKKVKTKTEVSPSNSGKGSGSKDKDKSKKSTQQIDWISRALDRLSSKLDLVKAKYDNLFKSKKAKDSDSLLALENKNLDKQYKLLKRTEKYQEKAQKKYTKKANSVKLSDSLKKAVREGRISGKMSELIATYGEKKAKKIQKYQDYYDKAQDAKKNRQSTKTAKKENRIQKYQNIVDNAEEKRSLAQARKENAQTAEEKNSQIQEEKKHIETSYQYQIKIAKLEKDSLKVAQLQAEKKKELLDLDIEQHQNLADQHQSTLDRLSAEKELATKAADKNSYIDSEKAITEALYNEKIAIAKLEGKTSEAEQLQYEMKKALRDLDIERHQNIADEYQAQLDLYSAEKENLNTASDKNNIVDQEKEKTRQLYAEKIEIARIEGNIAEQLKLQQELDRQMVVLEKEKFDNITHYYENLRKLSENSYKDLTNASNELEARGLIVTASLYNDQINLNNTMKSGYEEELRLLKEQLPHIKQGTDEWYNALDSIQACKDGISNCTKENIGLNQSIRDIGWQLNEKISSRFQLISSELELARKLMSNKKLVDDGTFTKEGTATLATYYMDLQLAYKETESFGKTLSEMYEKLQKGADGYTDQAAWDEYIEKYKEYLDLQGKEFDIQQSMIEMMKDKYESELDYLQDIINRRKELLQITKDSYDYQRTLEEKTKNVGTIQKQLQALSGDDSEAAKTKIQQLKVSLDETIGELESTEYTQYISDQQTMLDNLYNEYSDFMDDKLNDVNDLLEEAVSYLSGDTTKKSFTTTLKETMNGVNTNLGNGLSDILSELSEDGTVVKAINGVAENIISYFDKQQKNQETANGVIDQINNIGDVFNDVNALARHEEAKKAYDNLATGGIDGENIQNYVDSASVSSLNTTGENVSKILKQAENAKNYINDIGTVTLNDESNSKIQKANKVWDALPESAKQLLNNSGFGKILTAANQTYTNLDNQEQQRKANARNEFANVIKQTYFADASTYAETGDQYSGNSHLDELLKNNSLYRDDGLPLSQAGAAEIMNRLTSRKPSNEKAFDEMYRYMKSIGFSNGGIAETLQKAPGMNGDDGWITVKKGEGILNPEQTKQFQKLVGSLDVLNPGVEILSNLQKPNYNAIPNRTVSQSIGNIEINMDFPNVTNYEEFRQKMQSDPKIEKMFKSMIYDKNGLSKYTIRM